MNTIEEKAKAYDNLLVKLQEAKVDDNVCDERYCCVIDDIVPELKESESEDEKIRKEIISYLHNEKKVKRYISDIEFDKWIAWLEKQAEQKSAWSEEDALRLEEVICMIEANGRWVRSDDAVKSVLDWLKSLQQRIGE